MKTPKEPILTLIGRVLIESRTPYVSAAAVIAPTLWLAIVTAEFYFGGRWAWSLPHILLCTPMAVLATFLLCDFRSAHKKPLSYGTLLAGPFGSTLLVSMCVRIYYDGWSVVTAGYWHDDKGGLYGLLVGVVVVGSVCVLSAIPIVVYFQRRSKIDEGAAAGQHRRTIPEPLVRSWRWAIEVMCVGLVLWYWILRWGVPIWYSILRGGVPTTMYEVIGEDTINSTINFGSCVMVLLLVTSLPSFRHYWRHGLFGLLVFSAWFVSLFCFPPV